MTELTGHPRPRVKIAQGSESIALLAVPGDGHGEFFMTREAATASVRLRPLAAARSRADKVDAENVWLVTLNCTEDVLSGRDRARVATLETKKLHFPSLCDDA